MHLSLSLSLSLSLLLSLSLSLSRSLALSLSDWIKSPDVLVKLSKVDAATGLPSDAGYSLYLLY